VIEAEELFYKLVDLSEPERRAYYAQHATRVEIRAEVESLIAHDSREPSLEIAVGRALELSLAQEETRRGPTHCGPYTIRSRIGSGGMGTVYLAERTDGEVRNVVAIKLMRWTAGDRGMLQRFLRERQILASLSHPNIARLIDAGHTSNPDGELQPYLVMDYIDGISIDEWARGRSVREVVRLFLAVCDAVAHAHRHLIIHRDLKPGNILVTRENAVKLLDFGIAREVEGDRTLSAVAMFTPDYASPEQALGKTLGTATDIYSLGAVLYALCAGRSPQHFPTPPPEGFQMALMSRPVEPPGRFRPECRGDLDAILLCALRKEPSARYASVDQFAEDLKAYLDQSPVRARYGEMFYRARKYARRFWMPAAACLVVFAALTAGVLSNQRERRIAERRFAEVRGLTGKLLDVEAQIRDMPGGLDTRKYIVESVLTSLDGLRSQVHDDAPLTLEVARAYYRVASVQAERSRSSFGLHKDALHSLLKAESLLKEMRARKPRDGGAAELWFDVESDIANRLYDTGDERGSVQRSIQTANELQGALSLFADAETRDKTAIRVNGAAARALLNAGRAKESLVFSGRELELAENRAARTGTPDARLLAASITRAHATGLRYAGELQLASEFLRRAEQHLPSDLHNKARRRELQNILYYRGVVLGEARGLSLERFEDAAVPLSAALDILRESIAENWDDGEARVDFAQTALKLGEIQETLHKLPGALATFDEALAVLSRAPDSNRYAGDYAIRINAESSLVLAMLGRKAESAARLAQALRHARQDVKSWPPDHFGPTSTFEFLWRVQAEIAAHNANPREAVERLEDSLARFRADADFHPAEDLDDAFRTSVKLKRIEDLYAGTGDLTQAEHYRGERRELWRTWQQKLPGNRFITRQAAALERKETASVR